MNEIKILTPKDWTDFELLDSGREEKLERYGKYLFVRPDTKALWQKTLPENNWKRVVAHYMRDNTGGGKWFFHQKIPATWIIQWKNLTFLVKPTGFKHMGIFPEQAALWEFIMQKIKLADRPISVLNLFAYTGGSTIAAASAGAAVTHVDSAKEILTWANENAKLSKLEDKNIRWIPEDAITFVKREIKRGKKYDAIIMDPPKFGRGVKNEVWKIEEDLPKLIDLCSHILTDRPLFVLINAYAVSYSSVTLGNMLMQMMRKHTGSVTNGELMTEQTSTKMLLPNSICGMWES